MLRAELYRDGQVAQECEILLFLQGETTGDLTAAETDVFIAQAQAFVDTLRVLRRQMH